MKCSRRSSAFRWIRSRWRRFEGAAKPPTYRVHAYDSGGKEMLAREFTVTTIEQPYNGVMPEYEKVEVDTGWVRMESGATAVLDRASPPISRNSGSTTTRSRCRGRSARSWPVITANCGPEFAPPFDTLKIDIHMSEPDYELGIDKERISSLEALQEDTFYSTENFVNMMGDLEAGRAVTYAGRIIPIVHASDDGKDGHIQIEFYAKPAGESAGGVELDGRAGQAAQRKAGNVGAERCDAAAADCRSSPRGRTGPREPDLAAPADYKDDEFEEWIKLEGKEQVERGIFPAEQAQGQLALAREDAQRRPLPQ